MDHKAFKSDMTYALKKMTKEGKTITFEVLSDNLQLVDGKLTLPGDKVDVLEAFVLVKGYKLTSVKEVSDWVASDGTKHHHEWFHHEAFGIPALDLISEQSQIAKTDLYDFMDGLENAAGNDKTEFYKVGVYLREKFTPIGVRTETLQKTKYQDTKAVETVRKFIVHNRVIPGGCAGSSCTKPGVKGLPSIVEVECEVFTPLLSPPGEFAARILKPEWLWEPTRTLQNGVLVDVDMPPVYCSHAIYETVEAARDVAHRQIRSSLEFEVRKGRIPSFTEEEFKTRCDLVQEVHLS